MIVVSFLGLLFIRNFVALFLIPPVIAWVLCKRFHWNKIKAFAICYFFAALVSILLHFLPALDPLKIISQKQKDFLALPAATTQLVSDTLQPTLSNLLLHTPAAINHAFLRPYLWEYPGKFIFILSIELLLYQVLFLRFVFFKQNKVHVTDPFIPCAILFSLSLLILSGFIVTNAGALVRYRSLYFPFFITPLLTYIKWPFGEKVIL